jgi:SNF2 family DNA or RNA helicase
VGDSFCDREQLARVEVLGQLDQHRRDVAQATGVVREAGGLVLNLTAAEHAFLLDPWWNPAVEAQAIDRAHRIGQTRPVFAYRLIARDIVEKRILELQAQKRELVAAIPGEGNGPLRDLAKEDLELQLS